MRVFLNWVNFPLSHPYKYTCFFKAYTQLKSQSVMDGWGFSKQEAMYTTMAWNFPIQYFFGIARTVSRCMSTFFESLLFFFHGIYPFGFSVMFFLFPYFIPTTFFYLCIYLLVSPCTFSTYKKNLILKGSLLLVLLDPVPMSFEFLLFPLFLFIYFF